MEDQNTSEKHEENTTGEMTPSVESASYKRPTGLSILLIFSLVYNGFMFLVLAAGLFYNSIVRQILEQYYQQIKISPEATFLLNILGTLLFGISIFGLIKLWMGKRSGFWYFATVQVIILFTLLVFLRSYDWVNMAIAATLMIVIGLYAAKMK